ncbi:hypothetical protein GCM10027057_04110 [Marisediminicola antarctica]
MTGTTDIPTDTKPHPDLGYYLWTALHEQGLWRRRRRLASGGRYARQSALLNPQQQPAATSSDHAATSSGSRSARHPGAEYEPAGRRDYDYSDI